MTSLNSSAKPQKPLRFGLVGVQGFARSHLRCLEQIKKEGLGQLEALVIRPSDLPQDHPDRLAFKAEGMRIHDSLDALLDAEKGKLDVISIPCGIHEHSAMSQAAMKAGFHVFCEKPAAGTPEEALAMARCAKQTNRILALGFQNLHAPSVQKIKQAALSQTWGPLEEAWSYALWPRTSAYYGRNAWAGKDSFQNKTIHDSPIQNGLAHYLQNLLWIAGTSFEESAYPKEIWAENWQAKNLECADTQCIKIRTREGIPLFFAGSHALIEEEGPFAWFRFGKALVEWKHDGTSLVKNHSGEIVDRFDNGNVDIFVQAFRDVCNQILGGAPSPSNIHNGWQHSWCVHKSFESSGGTQAVDPQYIKLIQGGRDPYSGTESPENCNLVISGLEETLRYMAEKRCGFSESGAPWAKQAASKWISFEEPDRI